MALTVVSAQISLALMTSVLAACVSATAWADGTEIIKNTDGSSVEKRADGTKLIRFKDGGSVEKRKDGTEIVTNPDHSVVRINPDGSKVHREAKKSK